MAKELENLRIPSVEKMPLPSNRGKLRVLYKSQVVAIHPAEVELGVLQGDRVERVALANDDVFVMAGGTPPVETLERSGVSLDGSQRESGGALLEQGSGVLRALAIGFGLSMLALAFALWNLRRCHNSSALVCPWPRRHPGRWWNKPEPSGL